MRTDKLNLKIKKVLGDNTKKILIKLLFPFRNNFILFNISNKALEYEVNLNYWDESNNLGDTLAPVIVKYALSLRDIDFHKKVASKKHLYAVGSVLTAGIQDATVWGSGVLNARLSYRLQNRQLDVRAVRGPLTGAILEDYGYIVPKVYADPAILMPEIFNPEIVQKKYEYGIILHKDYVLSENDKAFIDNKKVKILNIKTDNYELFIKDLKECNEIISSSLHGIILSEVYGVPAILLRPQVDYLKYYDYYFSTGRLEFPIANTVSDAVCITPTEIPEFTTMKKQLLDAFPYDLYE